MDATPGAVRQRRGEILVSAFIAALFPARTGRGRNRPYCKLSSFHAKFPWEGHEVKGNDVR